MFRSLIHAMCFSPTLCKVWMVPRNLHRGQWQWNIESANFGYRIYHQFFKWESDRMILHDFSRVWEGWVNSSRRSKLLSRTLFNSVVCSTLLSLQPSLLYLLDIDNQGNGVNLIIPVITRISLFSYVSIIWVWQLSPRQGSSFQLWRRQVTKLLFVVCCHRCPRKSPLVSFLIN